MRTKDLISTSEITLDKAVSCSVRKDFLKTQVHNTLQKNNLCISDALLNINKPINFYITYSVRKDTIGHLTIDINLTFYRIIWVNKRFKNILKILAVIDNAAGFIWSTLYSILILLFQKFQKSESLDFTILRSIFNFQFYLSIFIYQTLN